MSDTIAIKSRVEAAERKRTLLKDKKRALQYAPQKEFLRMTPEELSELHYEVMVHNYWSVCFGKKPLFWNVYRAPLGFEWLVDIFANRAYRKYMRIIRERIGWIVAYEWESVVMHGTEPELVQTKTATNLTNEEFPLPYCQQIPQMTIYQNA